MNTAKILLLFLVLGSGAFAHAQILSDTNLMDNKQEYATLTSKSLSIFRELVTDDNAKTMGFTSARELEEASTGVPMPVMMIQLDDLREYKRNDDVSKLFKNLHQQLIPVMVGNEVRSSVTVEQSNERWQAVSFGSANLAKLLVRTTRENSASFNIAAEKYFVVHVAALRHYFIAYRDENEKMMFIPVLDNDNLKFKAGTPMSAEDALVSLKSVAEQYNGLPM